MTTPSKIRIAIIGGGLAGAALFRGLAKIPHLEVDIFESAPTFREQGQAVGLNHNAVRALELLGLEDCLSVAGAVRIKSMRCMIGEGPDVGKVSFDLALSEKGTRVVHRPTFLAELLKNVDSSRMHAGKKLETLEQGDEVRLFFEDGSTFTCDVLLGADGIHSMIRKSIIGTDHPAASPTFAGWWTVWMVVPFEAAQQHLGKQFMDPDNPRQFVWCGRNALCLHDAISNNTLSQCVMVIRVPEDSVTDPTDWRRTITKEELQRRFAAFHPAISGGMIDLVASANEGEPVPLYGLWHHMPTASSYVNGRLAIVGDAADATTPWQGSGGGMAMEDAYILSKVFAEVHDAKDVEAVLKAYEHVNKPRRSRLVQSSYETGLVFTGCDDNVGLDPEKMRDRLQGQWDWILHVDLEENGREAIKFMKQIKASAEG